MAGLGGLRQDLGLSEHRLIDWREFPDAPTAPDNIILPRADGIPDWIADTTAKIGDWRSRVRDVYLRWAITINAMHEAKQNWVAKEDDRALYTKTIRADKSGAPEFVKLAVWPASVAAENYERATPALSGYGFMDLFGLLEEIVFEWHLIHLDCDPRPILKGDEFKDLRRLFRDREESDEARTAWTDGWSERLKSWHRKRLYDGLHRVFLSYFERSKLERPSNFTKTNIEDWAKTIECFAETRNLLVHGQDKVSDKLEELCTQAVGDVMDFKAGEPLVIELKHLMYFEMFFDQLLSTLNMSLVEAFEKQKG